MRRKNKAEVNKVQEQWFNRTIKMSDIDIINWVENLMAGTGRAISDFRHTRDFAALVEAHEGVSAQMGAILALMAHNDYSV